MVSISSSCLRTRCSSRVFGRFMQKLSVNMLSFLLEWKNHEAAPTLILDTCSSAFLTLHSLWYHNNYTKLLLSRRCQRDFWFLIFFCNAAREETKMIKKQKHTPNEIQSRTSSRRRVEKKKKEEERTDLKINLSPIWDATTKPAAPCRLFRQRRQTAGGIHPEGNTTHRHFMKHN